MSDDATVQFEARMSGGATQSACPDRHASFVKLVYSRGVLLLAIAAPGGIRLLQLAAFTALYGLTASGVAASALNVAQLLGTVSAIGFCSLLLTRLPSSDQGPSRCAITGRLLVAMLITTLAVLAVGFICSALMGQIRWFGAVSILVLGWSVQQFARHVLIAMRQYLLALLHDFIFMGASFALLWIGRKGVFDLFVFSAAFASCCALSILVPFFAYRSSKSLFATLASTRSDFQPGIGLGANNLLSAAPSLLLVPAVSLFAGHTAAGLIAFASNILNVLGLIPRAMSINTLVKMVDRASIATSSGELKRSIHRYLAVTMPLFVVALLYGVHAYATRLAWFELTGSLLLMLAFALQQLALPVSNVLMKRERTAGPVLAGAASSAAFVLICSIGYVLAPTLDLRLAPFLGVAVAGCVRFALLTYQARSVERADA
ncbi:hypothetical protein D8I24_7947 [Cupriavidus necator H850]|uniref:hypothetical protein n=1 Tax=Cupriavidus necator TaxID=106590 RepID=UPI00129E2660|nr:hypothetical protein [Cupriavidus necator]KAI3595326.1 hypothetical protein D8I24_7947 [Cupriavidus necator H850]